MADRILFVDDEQGVLDGYERVLRKEFFVTLARGGLEGLAAIEEHGPFAVVISDMRMPGMNGAEFLAQVRHKAPSTVRMLLTGFTDLSAAIDAVNEGNIFRFLTKPCRKEVLIEAINIGLAQYLTSTAEKELLRRASAVEESAPERLVTDICQWDNFEGPTGLPGPTQARKIIAPLFGSDSQCYVVMLTLTALRTLQQRYGEELAGDYLNVVAQFVMQELRSEDRLFHWERDVLMAAVHRQISPAAMHSEIVRLTASSREQVMEIKGKTILIASPITFDLLPASQFSDFKGMLEAFGTSTSGKA